MKLNISKILLWISIVILAILNTVTMKRNTTVTAPMFVMYAVFMVIACITGTIFIYRTQYKADMAQGINFGL